MGWIGIAPKKIRKLAQSWEMQNQNNTEVLPHQIGYSSLKKQEKEEYEKMKTRKEFGELQLSYLAERDVKYASAVYSLEIPLKLNVDHFHSWKQTQESQEHIQIVEQYDHMQLNSMVICYHQKMKCVCILKQERFSLVCDHLLVYNSLNSKKTLKQYHFAS